MAGNIDAMKNFLTGAAADGATAPPPPAPTVTTRPASPTAPLAPADPRRQSMVKFLGDPNTPAGKPIDNYGLDFATQRDFLAASSDDERTLVLESGKKAGKWLSYGNQPIIPERPEAGLEWWVMMPNGKKVAVINPLDPVKTGGAAFLSKPGENIAMALSAFIPESWVLGAGLSREVGGALKTGALEGKGAWEITKHIFKRIGAGGAFAIVRSAYTGAAAALGAGVDDATKAIRGLWAGSTEEEMTRLLHEARLGFTAEFISRTLSGGLSPGRAGYAPLLTQEQKATVKSAIDRGMVPGVRQATAGKSIIGGWEQALVETMFGGPFQQKRNLAAMRTEAKKQLMATGMNESQADTMLTAVLNSVHARIDREGVNKDLRDRANQIVTQLQANVDTHKTMLEGNIQTRMTQLESLIGSPDARTQELAQQELVRMRRQFGQDANDLYAKVDAVVAGSERPIVVDWGAVKAKAREVWRELPRDQFGNPVFKDKPELGGALMEIMNMPEFTDFKTAQKARKALYDAGEYKNLTPGRNSVLFNQLGDEIDRAFGTADFSGVQGKAVQALKDADKFWRDNIDRFQGLRVRQLMSDALRADPEEVANIIFKRNFTAEAENFKRNMTPEGWANVASAYWSRMTNEARDAYGNIDPDRFVAMVKRQRNLLRVAFGDQKAAAIERFAEHNAALHGKLPVDQLTPDNFTTSLQRWQAEDAALQEKLKSNYVTMLMDQSPERRDAIEFMLAEPGRIKQAKAFYSENSREWTQIKGHAMGEILARGLTKSGDLTKALFEAGGLSGALSHFTDAQLTELFGSSQARDLRQLAKDIDLVQGRPGHKSTGAFAAAVFMLHPLSHIVAIAELATMGQLMASPWFVRWLAAGFEPETQRHIAHWVKVGKAIAMFTVPGIDQYFGMLPSLGSENAANQSAAPLAAPQSQLGRRVGHL